MKDTVGSSDAAQSIQSTQQSARLLPTASFVGGYGENACLRLRLRQTIEQQEQRILMLEANVENLHKVLHRMWPKWFHLLQVMKGKNEQSSGHR